VSHLIIPDRIVIRAHFWTPHSTTPYVGQPIAFNIRTFARAKNDYTLGPFFSDSAGVLALTRREFEYSAAGHLDAGAMTQPWGTLSLS